MGRWTQYDEDSYRLPEGVKRVGYDADSGCYYFRDSDGILWRGSEGAQFGEMTRVEESTVTLDEDSYDADLESAPTRGDGYQALHAPGEKLNTFNMNPYRTLFPFFLIICVVLLLVWRLVFQPNAAPRPESCPDHSQPYWIQAGDTCWDIALTHKTSLDKLVSANPLVDCDKLIPGKRLCVPEVTRL